MKWYLQTIKNYANFSGRARRKEFWMFFLINVIVGTIISIIDSVAGSQFLMAGKEYGIISLIYSLFIFIPSLAVEVRRLHDIDKSAWWMLFCLIPVVGWILLFVYSIKEGTSGDNTYGADPKTVQ